MPRRPYRTLDDLDIEDIGVFEYLDDTLTQFVPAPAPPPPPRPEATPQDELLDNRLRLELPMLWAWIMLSCLLTAPWQWLVLGSGLIALNGWLRAAYSRRGLRWLYTMYVAAGGGQIAAALANGLALQPLAQLVGLYAFGLLFTWIVLELRYQLRASDYKLPQNEEDRIYYIYG